MFKIKKIEEIKSKIQQIKFAAVVFGVVFLCMILNLIYLNYKISSISDAQVQILDVL